MRPSPYRSSDLRAISHACLLQCMNRRLALPGHREMSDVCPQTARLCCKTLIEATDEVSQDQMVGQTGTVGSSLSPAWYKCLPARDGIKELLGSQGARLDHRRSFAEPDRASGCQIIPGTCRTVARLGARGSSVRRAGLYGPTSHGLRLPRARPLNG
jgi:hypothetical protein